ncbi:MAG: SGNH/GDSL hydrolase family protein [Paludibacter sp.]
MNTKLALNFFLIYFFIMTVGNIQAQDWASLEHYRKENNTIGLPKKEDDRVVFMGNSITESWKVSDPEFFDSHKYIDRGISGQTTPQMLIRFRQDVIALQPKVVVILAGTNDIAGNTGPSTLEMIEDNLASMAELANANGIRVILCSILPVYDYPWKPGLQPAMKIVTVNNWIKLYCKKRKFIYLDYFTLFADERFGMKAALTIDGVHTNIDGYKIMEHLVEPAIQNALKQRQ